MTTRRNVLLGFAAAAAAPAFASDPLPPPDMEATDRARRFMETLEKRHFAAIPSYLDRNFFWRDFSGEAHRGSESLVKWLSDHFVSVRRLPSLEMTLLRRGGRFLLYVPVDFRFDLEPSQEMLRLAFPQRLEPSIESLEFLRDPDPLRASRPARRARSR